VLTELRISGFAIIDSVRLPLEPGFNLLSGETGAGKSIVVGAIGFLLGERGTSDIVRTGSEKAVVEGQFDLADRADVLGALDEFGIDIEEGTLVLRREMSSGGRGRAWANGSPVTANVLAQIGRTLVNVHGQHEAQSLLDADSQRAVLDTFAGAVADAAVVSTAYAALGAVRRDIAELEERRRRAT
jgi:DNA repair protein RecN (Recombination protein N)